MNGEEVGQADPLRHFPGKASCIRPMCTERVQSFSIGFLKGPSWLETLPMGGIRYNRLPKRMGEPMLKTSQPAGGNS